MEDGEEVRPREQPAPGRSCGVVGALEPVRAQRASYALVPPVELTPLLLSTSPAGDDVHSTSGPLPGGGAGGVVDVKHSAVTVHAGLPCCNKDGCVKRRRSWPSSAWNSRGGFCVNWDLRAVLLRCKRARGEDFQRARTGRTFPVREMC